MRVRTLSTLLVALVFYFYAVQLFTRSASAFALDQASSTGASTDSTNPENPKNPKNEWVVVTRTPLPLHDLRHSLVRYWREGNSHLYVLRGDGAQISQYTAVHEPRVVAPNVRVEAQLFTGSGTDALPVDEYMARLRHRAATGGPGTTGNDSTTHAGRGTGAYRAARDLPCFTPTSGRAEGTQWMPGSYRTSGEQYRFEERSALPALLAPGTGVGFELGADAELCRTNGNVDGRLGYTAGAFSWGIDRVDQMSASADYTFCAGYTGTGSHIYILDTGVANHATFGGRVNQTWSWYTPSGVPVGDGNGHGTHVAGLAASAVYGTATNATIHNIQVLDEDGYGSFASVAAGILWVYENGHLPGVINMSLGAPGVFIEYVSQLIADLRNDRGIISVVSAGNAGADACSSFPASAPAAFTVGSSAPGDVISSFSNHGPCVNVMAPGSSMISAFGDGTLAVTLSGTSMSAPVVTGLMALVQEKIGLEIAAVEAMRAARGASAAYTAYYGTRAYSEWQHRVQAEVGTYPDGGVQTQAVPDPDDMINLLLHDAHYSPFASLPAGTPNIIPLSVRTESTEIPVPDPPPVPTSGVHTWGTSGPISGSVALYLVLYLILSLW